MVVMQESLGKMQFRRIASISVIVTMILEIGFVVVAMVYLL